jgi:hypothetical protein
MSKGLDAEGSPPVSTSDDETGADKGTPLTSLPNGVVWWWVPVKTEEKGLTKVQNRSEGPIEVYPHWVRVLGGMGNWIPRERVEQIHER